MDSPLSTSPLLDYDRVTDEQSDLVQLKRLLKGVVEADRKSAVLKQVLFSDIGYFEYCPYFRTYAVEWGYALSI